jgi:hypothetical protein
MESIAKGYIKGIYKEGFIHTDTYVIPVAVPFPGRDGEHMYVGDIYLDALERPYINVEKEVSPQLYGDSFIHILLKPKTEFILEKVTLHNSIEVWVDFTATSEKCDGFYQCTLEFRDGVWYFVTKGCDRLDS